MPIERVLIDSLCDSETALICNAIPMMGVEEPHTYAMDGRVQCLTPELPPLVGEAITIKIDSATPGGEHQTEEFHQMQELIEASDLPRVIVVETTSPDPYRECVLGDGMAKGFVAAGAVGMVTTGGVRDMLGIADQGFRVFAVARVVQHANMRWSGLGEPVAVGGITVRTGDLIHGDQGGCIVVPESTHQHIVDACRLVLDFEKRAHVLIRRTDLTVAQKRAGMEGISGRHQRNVDELLAT